MGGIFGGVLALSDFEWCVAVGDRNLHPKKASERLSAERYDYLFHTNAEKAGKAFAKKKQPSERVAVVKFDRQGNELSRRVIWQGTAETETETETKTD